MSESEGNPPSNPKDPVQVFCRLRPLQRETDVSCVTLLSPTTLSLVSETRFARKEVNYVFRHVFTSYSGQRELFAHVALPLLEDVANGKNGLLFTYGVTGSGKTYTLTGEQLMPGIMPRCINTLFNSIEDHQAPKFVIKSDRMNGFELQSDSDALEDRLKDAKSSNKRFRKKTQIVYENDGTRMLSIDETCIYSVFVTYTEIYNNTVYDLLDESAGKVLQAKIIREDSHKNMYVNGVVEVEVKSAAEAFELFHLGQRRKRMGNTALNAESSRSHSTFSIRVVQYDKEKGLLKVGQLSLVDLAGSERSNRTQNSGLRLKEASSINNSLMSLRTCMEILRENQLTNGNKLVPYRDSRLTLLFKNYFEGEGQVRMIVCVNPSVQDCEENLQVLKFAEMTQDVKVPRAESRYTPYRKTPKPKTAPASLTAIRKAKKTLSFGPKIPTICFSSDSPAENVAFCDDLLKVLRNRRQKGEENDRLLVQKEEHFRKRLTQLNQATVLSTSEMRSLKALLKKEKQTSANLNMKIADIEIANDNLTTNNEELQDVIKTLYNTVNEKNMKINQNYLEKEKVRQKLALQSEKMTQELDDKLRLQREHLNAAMQAKEAKILKVKQILESDTVSLSSADEPVAPLTNSQVRCEAQTQLPQMEDAETITEFSPVHESPQLRSASLVAGRRHRRTRSAGEIWLEHNSIKPVPLGTVLQPVMKKRKSVTKLKRAADVVNPRQNKYCLLAQEPDVDGDIETKLYKGDIVRTCGGGAQVIFNDVELLRQESPTNVKGSTPRK